MMNPLVTIILPSYLGTYENCAWRDRPEKFRRAVKSFLSQDYINKRLLIVSDGCEQTSAIYRNEFNEVPEITLIEIEKQVLFSGAVRQAGLEKCLHGIVAYLDSDDFFINDNHITTIATEMEKAEADWVYWDKIMGDGKKVKGWQKTFLTRGAIGTSSIAHIPMAGLTWAGCDGYGHDWFFIERMMGLSPNYKKIEGTGYAICHIPKRWEC